MDKSPLVLEIKGNSLDDGPGIRTVVFFKGCPLSCAWCQNPESRFAGVEVSFDKEKCISCNTCIAACPKAAIDKNNPFFVDREKCDLCFDCVEKCPSEALKRVGKQMAVDQILEIVKKYIPFYNVSGGGVTLSGGEATLFPYFLSTLLKELKALGVRTLLETCGFYLTDKFDELVYPHLDLIYFDLKLFDPLEHKKHCGVSNTIILDNFSILARRSNEGRVPVLPRIPLVPGVTATRTNLRAISRFLKSKNMTKVSLLPYNPLWHEKMEMIGNSSDYKKHDWMQPRDINSCRKIFLDFEIV